MHQPCYSASDALELLGIAAGGTKDSEQGRQQLADKNRGED
jgi:hypothetical protein